MKNPIIRILLLVLPMTFTFACKPNESVAPAVVEVSPKAKEIQFDPSGKWNFESPEGQIIAQFDGTTEESTTFQLDDYEAPWGTMSGVNIRSQAKDKLALFVTGANFSTDLPLTRENNFWIAETSQGRFQNPLYDSTLNDYSECQAIYFFKYEFRFDSENNLNTEQLAQIRFESPVNNPTACETYFTHSLNQFLNTGNLNEAFGMMLNIRGLYNQNTYPQLKQIEIKMKTQGHRISKIPDPLPI